MQEHEQADRDRASFSAMVEGAILDIYDRLQLAKRQSKFNNQAAELRVIGAMVGFHIASYIGDLRQECEREGLVKGEPKDTATGIQRLYSDIYTSQKRGRVSSVFLITDLNWPSTKPKVTAISSS